MSVLLNEDDGLEFELPKHQRYACHLLNLIATADAMKATSNDEAMTANVLHFGTNVEDQHLWPKPLKMCAPSSCCARMPPGGTPCSWQWRDC